MAIHTELPIYKVAYDLLGAARGLLIGLALGALCWCAIALAVWAAL